MQQHHWDINTSPAGVHSWWDLWGVEHWGSSGLVQVVCWELLESSQTMFVTACSIWMCLALCSPSFLSPALVSTHFHLLLHLGCCSELIIVTITVTKGARFPRTSFKGMLPWRTRTHLLSLIKWWPDELESEGMGPPSCSNLRPLQGPGQSCLTPPILPHIPWLLIILSWGYSPVLWQVISLLFCLLSIVCVPPSSPQSKHVNVMVEKKLRQLWI